MITAKKKEKNYHEGQHDSRQNVFKDNLENRTNKPHYCQVDLADQSKLIKKYK